MDKQHVNKLLTDGVDLATRMKAFDWSSTRLGPYENWPASLRSIAAMVLENRFPMTLWWGSELLHIYNHAYVAVLGGKHPKAMGAPGAEVWQEIWHIIGPQSEHVLSGKGATWNEHLLLPMNRKGFIEETYFTFSYSPVRDDDGGIGGVLVTCQETTVQVQSERQLLLLRDLGAQPTPSYAEDACKMAAEVLATNNADFPFSLLYLVDDNGSKANLVASAGLDNYMGAGQPSSIPLNEKSNQVWPLFKVSGDSFLVVEDVSTLVGEMPTGCWDTSPEKAVAVALTGSGGQPYGYLVIGVSPLRALNDSYNELIRLAAGQISRGIASARAHEEERKRLEALAELDRVKTAFFLNVSHELRTPLTLMLGPTEDALRSPKQALAPDELIMVHRNALRMLKLVNTLLDFSRIEAGRTDMNYAPTDLSRLTQDLASNFRSAIEKAGLTLVLDTPELNEKVYVDCDKWEKVVLNLLSNALKFTFEGEIRVSLLPLESEVELQVQDTGIGIEDDKLPHIFERFNRVKNARGRTFEGTGIGLSLVHELVSLHGGSIKVQSCVGEGTTFFIRIPFGGAHLQSEDIGSQQKLSSTAIGTQPYIDEALRWLPDLDENEPNRKAHKESDALAESASTLDISNRLSRFPKARVLVVDDNADMREYLHRLIGDYWNVETVSNGHAAYERIIEDLPDLVLTDVMMPGIDGFELLGKLRNNRLTKGIPVILLSARAGEEARVEGLKAGADDYLVKPFAARELTARISACLDLAHVRKEAAEALRIVNERLKQEDRSKDEFLAMLAHELRNPLGAISNTVTLMEQGGEEPNRRYLDILNRQSKILKGLVNDLLDVSRITRGLVDINEELVDIVQITSYAQESVKTQIVENEHTLSLSLSNEPLMVLGDPVRLEQILVNLLTNATKYTDPGGTIALSLERNKESVELRVTDTGIGMTPEVLEHVFDLFRQAERGLDRAKGGLGIGLTIVHRLVELHGGTVEAHSEGLNKGSEFIVTLPLAASQTAVKPLPQQQLENEVRPKRVLVVEDDQDIAETLSLLLEVAGHQVAIVHDGASALAKLKVFEPDVMLLDIGLPGMDGYELAKHIRKQSQTLPLAALTGYGLEADKRRAEAAGFNAHFIKPVDLEALRAFVNES